MLRIIRIVKFPALAALLGLSSMLAGCDDSADSASAPASTTATTSTTAATVTSIDGAAKLTWVAPTEDTNGAPVSGLAGYYIYYGTDKSDLSQVIPITGADTTTYVVNGLGAGTYYFAVSAYNTMGMDSTQSDIASVTI
jgi:hypothetical protein